MERVSIGEGKSPILFVAPHGHPQDDTFTGIIVQSAAKAADAYYVINNCWKKDEPYNYQKEICNCNDITQLVDVPYDEFLLPILRFSKRILKKNDYGIMVPIHGASNEIRKLHRNLCVVVGYGAGCPESYTCHKWMKDFIAENLTTTNYDTYGGKAKGSYAGWSYNNLNQLFRKWDKYNNSRMHSMQLEIVKELRQSETVAGFFGCLLGDIFLDMLKHDTWYYNTPDV